MYAGQCFSTAFCLVNHGLGIELYGACRFAPDDISASHLAIVHAAPVSTGSIFRDQQLVWAFHLASIAIPQSVAQALKDIAQN